MAVIIDHVDGEIHEPAPSTPAPPQGPGGPAGSPEAEVDELERRIALMQRRRHRLQAD